MIFLLFLCPINLSFAIICLVWLGCVPERFQLVVDSETPQGFGNIFLLLWSHGYGFSPLLGTAPPLVMHRLYQPWEKREGNQSGEKGMRAQPTVPWLWEWEIAALAEAQESCTAEKWTRNYCAGSDRKGHKASVVVLATSQCERVIILVFGITHI